MSKYLFLGSYTAEGIKDLKKEKATARRATMEKVMGSLGGRMESLYFAFGESDVVTICDLPDNATAAGLVLARSASGLIRIKTTVLLTAEEMDRALAKAS